MTNLTRLFKVDLHMHSTFSDGVLTPTELVIRAYKKGMSVAALTDHDTVDGLDEMIAAGQKKDIRILPAIELSSYTDHEVHVLGYGIRYKDESFIKALQKSKDCRYERNIELKKRLKEVGIDLDDIDFGEKNFGRVKIAKLMIERGYVSTVDEAFVKYLGREGLAYVTGNRLTPQDAVRTIVDNGGVAVLAHPKKMFMNGELEDILKELVPVGLGGLECYYPGHSFGEIKIFTELASKYGLIATGGSDYHGPEEKDINCILQEQVLEKLGLELD